VITRSLITHSLHWARYQRAHASATWALRPLTGDWSGRRDMPRPQRPSLWRTRL